MYDRSFGRNDQKSSDLFKKIKFEIRDSICNLWDRIWKNARMLALFLYIFIKRRKGDTSEKRTKQRRISTDREKSYTKT